MRSETPRRCRHDEAGKGLIGFLVAIVVVGFVAYSLKQVFVVKHRYDQFNTYTETVLADATRAKRSVDDVRFSVVKKAEELGVPMDLKALEVAGDNNGWRLRYAYQDVVVLPGYTYRWDFTIDHIWKKF